MKSGAVQATLLPGIISERKQAPESTSKADFFSYLQEALQEVDTLQKQASASTDRLILGDQDNLHNTIIAYEKANLALQLTIEVRNRIIEAYQEIMRMQV